MDESLNTNIELQNTGFEQAALPTSSEQRKQRLLHFAIVGGGRKLHSVFQVYAESTKKLMSYLK